MKHPNSLKRQLGIGLAVGIVITWLAATLIATAVMRHELDEAFDSSLQETAQRLLSLVNTENATLVSRMEPDTFGVLMNNLIENALKYSHPNNMIDIEIGSGGTVSVRNESEIVPDEVMCRLKSRFVRGQTGTADSGLGLAIADTIARGANARLTLHSPASGRSDGFEAKLTLGEPG